VVGFPERIETDDAWLFGEALVEFIRQRLARAKSAVGMAQRRQGGSDVIAPLVYVGRENSPFVPQGIAAKRPKYFYGPRRVAAEGIEVSHQPDDWRSHQAVKVHQRFLGSDDVQWIQPQRQIAVHGKIDRPGSSDV